MSRKSDYISEARQNARQLWDAVNALKALQLEWNSLDYGSTDLDDDDLPVGLGDGEGENAGITQTEVGSCVFATTDAILALFGSGHGTNVASLL